MATAERGQKAKTQVGTKSSIMAASSTPVGVVGLGVMGAVIATNMLAAGHQVFAVAREETERTTAKRRVQKHLSALHKAGELKQPVSEVIKRFSVGAEYSSLAPCGLVVESIIEDLDAKHQVVERVEEVVAAATLIGSNTSGLSITAIQSKARNPKRVLGLHWVSSSPFVSVVEIMGGEHTSRPSIERARDFVKLWGKKPTIARGDVQGFLCNRICYAILREAFALLDEGVATPQEIDEALRASMGTWLPFVGPFGYLDLTGPAAYATVIQEIFPHLNNSQSVPRSLQELLDKGGQGIANGRGFYTYELGEGERRREQFDDFRRDVTLLVKKYERKESITKARNKNAKRANA